MSLFHGEWRSVVPVRLFKKAYRSFFLLSGFLLILGSCDLEDGPLIVDIFLDPTSPVIHLNQAVQINATVTYDHGVVIENNPAVDWSSSDPAVAAVGPTGLVSGVAAGTADITASAPNGGTGTATITVTVLGTSIDSLAVLPAAPTIGPGGTQQFSAIATLSDATTSDVTALASWASGNGGTASINASGLATGIDSGSASIIATVDLTSGTLSSEDSLQSATLTVIGVSHVVVAPGTAIVLSGNTQAFTATAFYTDGSSADVTGTAAWSSSDPGRISVNATGLGTAVRLGAVTVSASYGGVSSSASANSAAVTVNAPAIGAYIFQAYDVKNTGLSFQEGTVEALDEANSFTITPFAQTVSMTLTANDGQLNQTASFFGVNALGDILTVPLPGGDATDKIDGGAGIIEEVTITFSTGVFFRELVVGDWGVGESFDVIIDGNLQNLAANGIINMGDVWIPAGTNIKIRHNTGNGISLNGLNMMIP